MFARQKLILSFIFATTLTSCNLRSTNSSANSAPSINPGVDRTDVLIYGGIGSWRPEINSLKETLYSNGATYNEVKAPELDRMPLNDLIKYRLLVIPGGDAETVTKHLSPHTHARLREAVQIEGLDYLGFCAGAWLAVAPAPPPGKDVSYGIGFVDGPIQQTNFLYNQGFGFALTTAFFPDGTKRNQLWYGGPITPDVPGGVIAKYSDGTPAISQIWSGKGLVIISGLHPTATKSILTRLGIFDTEAIAPDLAWKILDAGINKKKLSAF